MGFSNVDGLPLSLFRSRFRRLVSRSDLILHVRMIFRQGSSLVKTGLLKQRDSERTIASKRESIVFV